MVTPATRRSSAASGDGLNDGYGATEPGRLGFCPPAQREEGSSRGAIGEAGHEWPADP